MVKQPTLLILIPCSLLEEDAFLVFPAAALDLLVSSPFAAYLVSFASEDLSVLSSIFDDDSVLK